MRLTIMLCATLPLTAIAVKLPSHVSTKSPKTTSSSSNNTWVPDPRIADMLSKSPPSIINTNTFKVWDWMWETMFVKLGGSAYRVYFVSENYQKDISRRFPQWVDNFERVIHTQAEWNEWVREKQYVKSSLIASGEIGISFTLALFSAQMDMAMMCSLDIACPPGPSLLFIPVISFMFMPCMPPAGVAGAAAGARAPAAVPPFFAILARRMALHRVSYYEFIQGGSAVLLIGAIGWNAVTNDLVVNENLNMGSSVVKMSR
ncbi:hypothetical protein E6O75_ATG04017 [Venturia nashicola]|uniref:Uncharacterized protein n=1 Tax=Venturia nashicola TaxID=86259 RepID=A0A4Z1PPK1_9PEZI|nr:hypothetical protein E6O75_ATG04017 [Venturia nashicola]